MIKLLKLASFLSIALAVSTVVLAGIGITRENSTFSERAEFLDTPTVVEILREQKDNIPKTDQDKTSPLVIQASAFALRIAPPEIKRVKTSEGTGRKVDPVQKGRPDTTKYQPERPATFNLVATCRYEKFPEKSLAMINITSKGPKWFQQGEMIGPNKIKLIEDGRIILDQNGKESYLEAPKDNTIKSLLKGSGNNVMATISPTTAGRSTTQPNRFGSPSTAGRTTGYSTTGRTIRRRPAQPTSEEARKAAERNNSEIKSILDGMSNKKKDGSKVDSGKELMQAVMKMLEAGSKKKVPPKKDNSK